MYHIRNIIFASEYETENCNYKKTEMGRGGPRARYFLGENGF